MNQTALHVVWHTPEQAKAVLLQVIGPFSRKHWEGGGGALNVVITPIEDIKTQKQRAYYHRVILTEIAEQATLDGKKFDMPVWKKYCRKRFVGYRWENGIDPTTGKKYRLKVRISTEELGLHAYSKLIQAVTAWAVMDLGVAFSVPKWQQYKE